MPRATAPRASPLALTVLFMLSGGPIHPYEMQRRIKHWGKDQVVNVEQRASLYKTIDRLQRAGLIAVRLTERDRRFPERTVYELTDEGLRAGREWLLDMLSTPRKEFPQFPAAVSFIFGLTPEEALAALEQRAALLRETLAGLDRELAAVPSPGPPKVTLLDTEFLRAISAAELAWVRGVVDQLRKGTLAWSAEELAEASKSFLPS